MTSGARWTPWGTRQDILSGRAASSAVSLGAGVVAPSDTGKAVRADMARAAYASGSSLSAEKRESE